MNIKTDLRWAEHPTLKDLNPIKLEIITELAKETDGKPIAQSIPHLMKANTRLKEHGLSFSDEETSLIMEILSSDMTDKEKQQLSSMRTMLKKRMGKQSPL